MFVDFTTNYKKELSDVTVELEFEGKKYYETANLIRHDGKLYVVPDDKLDIFQNANQDIKKSLIFNYGLDAFNFINSNKRKK